MFDTATNATQTPIVPQDRFVAECVRLEEAPPYAAPGEQPKPGARPGIRWILALYSATTGDQFYFQDEPYEFFQTTTANMQRGARAREFAEAFLGREIGEGEKLSPDMLLGKRCVGMVIHELSRDKTKKNAKLVAVEPFKNVATAPKPAPTQVSADPQIADVDRALIVTDLHKSVSRLMKLDAASAQNAQAAIAKSDLDTASLETLQELLDSIKKAITAALDA